MPLTQDDLPVQQVSGEQQLCFHCSVGSAEDEHRFVIDCPACYAIMNRFTKIFWGPAPILSFYFTLHASYDPKVTARFFEVQSGHTL